MATEGFMIKLVDTGTPGAVHYVAHEGNAPVGSWLWGCQLPIHLHEATATHREQIVSLSLFLYSQNKNSNILIFK